MKQIFTHDLSRDEAHAAANRTLAAYRNRFAQYDPHIEWLSELRAEIEVDIEGEMMSGELRLFEGEIHLQMNLPERFQVFEGPDETFFERALREEIGRAHNRR